MTSKCFVCFLPVDDFEGGALEAARSSGAGGATRNSNGFREHVKNEHNMWDYFFFMLHLKSKPETEYTGPESYVAEQVFKHEDYGWVPKKKALSLQAARGGAW